MYLGAAADTEVRSMITKTRKGYVFKYEDIIIYFDPERRYRALGSNRAIDHADTSLARDWLDKFLIIQFYHAPADSWPEG